MTEYEVVMQRRAELDTDCMSLSNLKMEVCRAMRNEFIKIVADMKRSARMYPDTVNTVLAKRLILAWGKLNYNLVCTSKEDLEFAIEVIDVQTMRSAVLLQFFGNYDITTGLGDVMIYQHRRTSKGFAWITPCLDLVITAFCPFIQLHGKYCIGKTSLLPASDLIIGSKTKPLLITTRKEDDGKVTVTVQERKI